jgi:hypothetical protein
MLEEYEVDQLEEKSAQYKQKWLNHINRMKEINVDTHITTS